MGGATLLRGELLTFASNGDTRGREAAPAKHRRERLEVADLPHGMETLSAKTSEIATGGVVTNEYLMLGTFLATTGGDGSRSSSTRSR
jgi:hypothetical protein